VASRAISDLPILDIGPLRGTRGDAHDVAAGIERACREHGFFYVTGHGVDHTLQERLEASSRRFFDRDLETKMQIRMELGGKAWRGYFPVGGELTSGKPDLKEGLYFGEELPREHPMVVNGVPLHGPNLFPPDMPEFRAVVLGYMDAMTTLGHIIMSGIAMSLGLTPTYFADRYTREPFILFRIFNYPGDPHASDEAPQWGVGEHTDYGLLTILKQDETGGLQVQSQARWIEAPPVSGTFLCNIGDMLDRMTGGRYRSTPHRVRNVTRRDRLSFPFFFDPNFHASIQPIALPDEETIAADRRARWDGASVHDFTGPYRDYVLAKVSNVFPQLRVHLADDAAER
jgi:isopenicillin N synthase-like dioxygenase